MYVLRYVCALQLQDKLTENEGELKIITLNLELQEKAIEARVAEKAAGTFYVNILRFAGWISAAAAI